MLTIEGADMLSTDIVHSSRDTLDRLDIDLAVSILRMNTGFLARMLGLRAPSTKNARKSSPSKNGASKFLQFLNQAEPNQLENIPGIGSNLSAEIVSGRPWPTESALTAIVGISESRLKSYRAWFRKSH